MIAANTRFEIFGSLDCSLHGSRWLLRARRTFVFVHRGIATGAHDFAVVRPFLASQILNDDECRSVTSERDGRGATVSRREIPVAIRGGLPRSVITG